MAACRNGFAAYCRYLFEPGKKIASDIDESPWLFPESLTMDKVKILMAAMPVDQQVKNGLVPRRAEKKRKSLSFSELTDIVVENKLFSVGELWQEAKARKLKGDDSLWETCGAQRSLQTTLRSIITGWHGDPASTLHFSAAYPLASFEIPAEARRWLDGAWRTHTLILSGGGGVGKTSLGAALLLEVCPRYHFITRLDQLKAVEFVHGSGLLWDEACASQMCIDEIKAVLDLEHGRSIRCRHVDGWIPSATPRVFSTNHRQSSFFGALLEDHVEAVRRRHIWCTVKADLRQKARSIITCNPPFNEGIDMCLG